MAPSSCAPCSPDPVDVADGSLGEVVVEDQVHALEVYTPAHQVSADQDPDLERWGMEYGNETGGQALYTHKHVSKHINLIPSFLCLFFVVFFALQWRLAKQSSTYHYET